MPSKKPIRAVVRGDSTVHISSAFRISIAKTMETTDGASGEIGTARMCARVPYLNGQGSGWPESFSPDGAGGMGAG